MASGLGGDGADAQRQIEQMVKFILNEAKDKAAEIEAKSMEDFNIEKLKILQNMKDKVRSEYAKKAKQAETERAIARSTAVNKARLKKIAARQLKINEAVKSASKSLADLSQDTAKYTKLCSDLITQAMLRLLEDRVVVRCRQEDLSIMDQAIAHAERKYLGVLKENGITTTIETILDQKHFLPPGTAAEGQPSCAGGVILSSYDGRISCDNTLDARLNLVVAECLPKLRKIIYENSEDQ